MRVQPHLPSRPLTAMVIDSSGAPWCACKAANRPAPPEPSIRMSVWRVCILALLPRDTKIQETDVARVSVLAQVAEIFVRCGVDQTGAQLNRYIMIGQRGAFDAQQRRSRGDAQQFRALPVRER